MSWNWTSSDSNVASVSSSGVITGKAAGTATITASTTSSAYQYGYRSVSASITVKAVSAPDVYTIELSPNPASVQVGKTVTLTPTVKKNGSVYNYTGSFTWSSSATGKATVNNGVVTGVAAGSSTVTAKATIEGNTIEGTATVNVTAAVPDDHFEWIDTEISVDAGGTATAQFYSSKALSNTEDYNGGFTSGIYIVTYDIPQSTGSTGARAYKGTATIKAKSTAGGTTQTVTGQTGNSNDQLKVNIIETQLDIAWELLSHESNMTNSSIPGYVALKFTVTNNSAFNGFVDLNFLFDIWSTDCYIPADYQLNIGGTSFVNGTTSIVHAGFANGECFVPITWDLTQVTSNMVSGQILFNVNASFYNVISGSIFPSSYSVRSITPDEDQAPTYNSYIWYK